MKIMGKIFLYSFGMIIISIVVSYTVVGYTSKKIVSLDLGKILIAETILSRKIFTNDEDKNAWLSSVKGTGVKLRKIILEVAGKNTLVIVAPAVIQGVDDITDKVLIKLGLPTNIPNPLAPANAVIPFFVESSNHHEEASKWMMP